MRRSVTKLRCHQDSSVISRPCWIWLTLVGRRVCAKSAVRRATWFGPKPFGMTAATEEYFLCRRKDGCARTFKDSGRREKTSEGITGLADGEWCGVQP